MIFERLTHLYYTKIKGMHKHKFKKIDSILLDTTSFFQRKIRCNIYKCSICPKTLKGLEDYQMLNLPPEMAYGKEIN